MTDWNTPNFLVRSGADRPGPTNDAPAHHFLTGDAATAKLSRIGETHDALYDGHILSPHRPAPIKWSRS